jgi:NADH dehydrogenase
MSNNRTKRIVILGGGFSGLDAAMELENTLARDPDVEITLVNRENFFLFTPMLHEVAASDLELTTIVNPLRKMLKGVNFFLGNVESIDLPRKEVIVTHGFDHHRHSFTYNHLVIGLGSTTNLYELPGLEKRSLLMKSLGDAIKLRNHLIEQMEEAVSECVLYEATRYALMPCSDDAVAMRIYFGPPVTASRVLPESMDLSTTDWIAYAV